MKTTVRTVARDVGRMLQALAALMLVSVVVPLVWGEFWAVPSLLVGGAIPFVIGVALARYFADAPNPGKLHGMMIAASGWFFVALFGSLPFLFVAWTIHLDPAFLGAPDLTGRAASTIGAFRNPINAFFESMSGFTGTGLTMTDDESALPATLQWWRSFVEWVGGVGVIVLTTAILSRPGSGSLTLYESEARSEKIHPSIVSTVRTIWWIFLLFTFVSILVLWLAGMPLWDAINHAMTGLATGGFSITDNSIATYDSAVIDFALVPVMILGSIAFPVHYLMLQGELKNIYTDLQTRWVFGYFGLGTLLLVAVLFFNGTYESLFEAVRYGLFQFVSAASCTGFQTAGSLGTRWSPEAQLTVSLGMFVGAAAGSTVGGIKLIRALTLIKGTAFRIGDAFYPDAAVRHFEVNDRDLTEQEATREFEEAAIIAFLWVVFLAVGIFVLLTVLPTGEFTLENVVFEVASAQGNVGLSSGITGASMPTAAKVMFLFNMWIGRLEIIPVLVLLRALFERGGVYR
ncbi:trk system potassium uptake protein TrkH [Halopelagius inordinatus]|uniref:Trk system potassium uptake protein TrkH n=1 Tax=Halopelagius inordinatus TaxID=553467 RepID=A0A1I2R5H8_9EURY|nr:TrkH family potassium uptake protein [Halopelagius inordinatus]SFG35732.1 trk system potassium uptake protein TrkH [Halopelagius inordinatus]